MDRGPATPRSDTHDTRAADVVVAMWVGVEVFATLFAAMSPAALGAQALILPAFSLAYLVARVHDDAAAPPRPRAASSLRCPLCLEPEVAAALTWRCGTCHADAHAECVRQLGPCHPGTPLPASAQRPGGGGDTCSRGWAALEQALNERLPY